MTAVTHLDEINYTLMIELLLCSRLRLKNKCLAKRRRAKKFSHQKEIK